MELASVIFKWLLLLTFAIRALYSVSIIDKPRKPISREDAASQILVSTIWFILIVIFWET